MNRKDFFRHSGRWAILTAIGMLSTFLAYNEKIDTPENCSGASLCKNCGKFVQCELPQANKQRRDGKRF